VPLAASTHELARRERPLVGDASVIVPFGATALLRAAPPETVTVHVAGLSIATRAGAQSNLKLVAPLLALLLLQRDRGDASAGCEQHDDAGEQRAPWNLRERPISPVRPAVHP